MGPRAGGGGAGKGDAVDERYVTLGGCTVQRYKGVGGCQVYRKKRYVTLEWSLTSSASNSETR